MESNEPGATKNSTVAPMRTANAMKFFRVKQIAALGLFTWSC